MQIIKSLITANNVSSLQTQTVSESQIAEEADVSLYEDDCIDTVEINGKTLDISSVDDLIPKAVSKINIFAVSGGGNLKALLIPEISVK